MDELLIQSGSLDSLSIIPFGNPLEFHVIVSDNLSNTSNDIYLDLDQAKEIRDYLDNILKDR